MVSDRGDFAVRTDPFRRELLVHCYRMMGSADEAEDLVQETYLRAWRSYDNFEGRSSLRTWLYRIATNSCLTALEHRGRRPLPSGLAAPQEQADTAVALVRQEIDWLQPLADSEVWAATSDPATVVVSRESLRLGLIAALQLLPPRQRAVLILRDVLAWSADEVADLLGTTTIAVRGLLRRARNQLEQASPREEQLAEPDDPAVRALLERYMAAFEHADAVGLAELLRQDAEFEMPPFVTWFRGRDAVAGFVGSTVFSLPGAFRMVATRANGQPAVAGYLLGADGVYRAHAIQVLTITTGGIAHIASFLDPALFRWFGLPPIADDSGVPVANEPNRIAPCPSTP
nr:sigma-70 family RNA polymerase sigma factor [Nocardia anaemiae]